MAWTMPWLTQVRVTLSKLLHFSEAQVPFLHKIDNDNQVVLFRMKRVIYVDYLAQCLEHRDCSTGFRGRLGQARCSVVREKSWATRVRSEKDRKGQWVGRACKLRDGAELR